jgi:hypothetical protein
VQGEAETLSPVSLSWVSTRSRPSSLTNPGILHSWQQMPPVFVFPVRPVSAPLTSDPLMIAPTDSMQSSDESVAQGVNHVWVPDGTGAGVHVAADDGAAFPVRMSAPSMRRRVAASRGILIVMSFPRGDLLS